VLRNRIIPVVLMRNGLAVQSKCFRRYQALGNPVTIVERLSDWASDELIYLDISRDATYDLGRDDLAAANRADPLEILSDIAATSFMPLTFGGRIRTLRDAATRVERGADKIVINTRALDVPAFVAECAGAFGSQCVVVGIDARRGEAGWSVWADGGRRDTRRCAVAWAREAEDRGAGEILIQSADHDGRRCGYDLELIAAVSGAVGIPLIALGGVGDWTHLVEGLEAGADAVAAANIFNHSEQSVLKARRFLHTKGCNVRPPHQIASGTAA
jgi:cyclase